MRAISLAPLTASELPAPEIISCASQAGFSHIDLRVAQGSPDIAHPMVFTGAMARDALIRMDAEGVTALGVEFALLEPHTIIRDFLPAIELGARLGGKHLVAGSMDPDLSRLADNFAALCVMADAFGLTVSLEPTPYDELKNLEAAGAVVRASGVANGGVLIDPIHFDRAGDRAEDIARLPPAHFHYAQICDAHAQQPTSIEDIMFQARNERLLPGQGGLDLIGILRALPPELPVSIEIPQMELARTIGPVDRARRAREATVALLEAVWR